MISQHTYRSFTFTKVGVRKDFYGARVTKVITDCVCTCYAKIEIINCTPQSISFDLNASFRFPVSVCQPDDFVSFLTLLQY